MNNYENGYKPYFKISSNQIEKFLKESNLDTNDLSLNDDEYKKCINNFSENESQTDSRDSSYNTDTSSESNSVNSDIIKNNKNNIKLKKENNKKRMLIDKQYELLSSIYDVRIENREILETLTNLENLNEKIKNEIITNNNIINKDESNLVDHQINKILKSQNIEKINNLNESDYLNYKKNEFLNKKRDLFGDENFE